MPKKNKNQGWLDRLQRVMPFGSSTCSKKAMYPPDEPSVIMKGRGCRVWDADGREFIDFRNALGPITLGYRFPAVDRAIRNQLRSGIIFGHPHPLECEVAEMLCEVIPCAEQARFLKTGGEAIAACIRLARHSTGREHVIQIGTTAGSIALPRADACCRGRLPRRFRQARLPAWAPCITSAAGMMLTHCSGFSMNSPRGSRQSSWPRRIIPRPMAPRFIRPCAT